MRGLAATARAATPRRRSSTPHVRRRAVEVWVLLANLPKRKGRCARRVVSSPATKGRVACLQQARPRRRARSLVHQPALDVLELGVCRVMRRLPRESIAGWAAVGGALGGGLRRQGAFIDLQCAMCVSGQCRVGVRASRYS